LIAWVSSGSTVNLLDTQAESSEPTVTESESPITGLALTPSGYKLAYATFSSQIVIQEPSDELSTKTWSLPVWLTNLSYSPDSTQLAGADLANFAIYFLDVRTGEVIRTLEWSESATSALYGVYLSPDWRLAAWVAQSAVQLMDTQDGNPGPMLVHQNAVSDLAWSPDSRLLATAAAAPSNGQLQPAVMIWDANTGELLNTLVQLAAIQSLAFSPDGRQLAVLDSVGNLQTWSVSR
jgi:WD40 repeat protein